MTKAEPSLSREKEHPNLNKSVVSSFLFYKAKHRSVINVETGQVTEDVGFYDSFHDAGKVCLQQKLTLPGMMWSQCFC